jgi:hypothetical protein
VAPLEEKIALRQIEEYRRRNWPQGNLRTLDEIAAFVKRMGMVLIFGSHDVPLPKLYNCADYNSDWWESKDLLQARKLAYNGRVVRHKATLISMDLLPAFLSLYIHSGGYLIYEEEYYWGKLSELANRVAEYLDEHGPTPVNQLRQTIMIPGKENTRKFHAALYELQSKFKTVSVGLIEKGWGVRVLGLFIDWVPQKVEKAAEKMPKEKAMKQIILRVTDTAGGLPSGLLPRMFGWNLEETAQAVEALRKADKIRMVQIKGKTAQWIASPQLAPG